jgi:hypothetical protein
MWDPDDNHLELQVSLCARRASLPTFLEKNAGRSVAMVNSKKQSHKAFSKSNWPGVICCDAVD